MMSWPVSNKLRISLVMSFSGQSAITKGIKAELNQVSKTSLSFSRVSFSSSGNSCCRAFSSDSATIHLVKSNVNCIFFDTANYISYLASHHFSTRFENELKTEGSVGCWVSRGSCLGFDEFKPILSQNLEELYQTLRFSFSQ